MTIDLGYDESGGEDTLIVSLQAAITQQAIGFSRQWKRRLGDLEFFHSKEFNKYNGGVFTKAGLDRKTRHDLLRDLSKLIRKHLLFSVTASVSLEEYESLTTQKFRSRFGTAYAFLIDICLLLAHARLEDEFGYKTHVNILVEDGHRNAEQISQILTELKGIPEELLPMPIRILSARLGSKKDHPILQAGDMAAYCHWQSYSAGDPTIWDALYKPGHRYRTWAVKCDKQMIQIFAEGPDGTKQFIRKQKELLKSRASNGNAQGALAVQPDGGGGSGNPALGDEKETGGVKDSKDGEAKD